MKTSQTLVFGAIFFLVSSQYAFAAPQAYRYSNTYAINTESSIDSDSPTATGDWTYHDESPSDRAISDRIRRIMHRDDRFSNNARNAQVVTKDGVVKLQGTVVSEAEKTRLGQIAKQTDGVKSVDNQLQVQIPDSPVQR